MPVAGLNVATGSPDATWRAHGRRQGVVTDGARRPVEAVHPAARVAVGRPPRGRRRSRGRRTGHRPASGAEAAAVTSPVPICPMPSPPELVQVPVDGAVDDVLVRPSGCTQVARHASGRRQRSDVLRAPVVGVAVRARSGVPWASPSDQPVVGDVTAVRGDDAGTVRRCPSSCRIRSSCLNRRTLNPRVSSASTQLQKFSLPSWTFADGVLDRDERLVDELVDLG